MYSIYKLSVGNHFYIGCSKRINKRIAQHRCDLKSNGHKNKKLQEVFNKSSEFDWEILREVEEKKEAYKTERALIKKEKANEYCCNIFFVEEHNLTGFEHSKETKEKISKAKKGKPSPRKGAKLSEEQKEKLRQSMLNRNNIYHQCPYCDMSSTNYRNMKRFHYDNCKYKSSNNNLSG